MPDGTYDESQRVHLRPFDTIKEMNDYLIDKINSIVGRHDILYHLGDFAFGDKSQIPALRERIRCRTIHLLQGNHDKILVKRYAHCFSSIKQYHELRYEKTLFTMCHYPLGSWNEIGKGSINVFGHCHGGYKRYIGRQIDVGVDVVLDMGPLSIKSIYEDMMQVDIELVDEHDENTNYG